MQSKLVKYIFSLLGLFLFHESIGQIHGLGREAYAFESNCPIKSINLYRSKKSRNNVKKLDSKYRKKKMYLSSTEFYNSNDQLESDLIIGKDGQEIGSSIYEYDSCNRLVRIKRNHGLRLVDQKRSYSENKIIIEQIEDGKVIGVSEQNLNEKDQITDWIFMNPQRDTIMQYMYEYDDNGNEIEFRKVASDKEKNYTYKKFYDEGGKMRRTETYDAHNKLSESITYEEVANANYKDTDYVMVHTKLRHSLYSNVLKTFETERIEFRDKYNNAIKIYTNQSCGMKGKWEIIYLDIEY